MKPFRTGALDDVAGSDTCLVHFDRARHALAEAVAVDEVKAIRDQAEAVRAYLKQRNASLEMQNQCAEIRLRAERRLGELLAETVRPGPKSSHDARNSRLPEGVSYMQSHRWQAVASVPEPTFEEHLALVKTRREELTTAGVLRLSRQCRQPEPAGAYDASCTPGGARAVLPLEALWPTPRHLLRVQAAHHQQWAGELQTLPSYTAAWCPPDVRREIDDAVAAAREAVRRAASFLAAAAETAPTFPIPWGDDTAVLLRINALQKNGRGYCGCVGCWQAFESAGRCRRHPLGSEHEPTQDEVPPDLTGQGGWTTWGLEADGERRRATAGLLPKV